MFDDFPVVSNIGKLSAQFHVSRSRVTVMVVRLMSFFKFPALAIIKICLEVTQTNFYRLVKYQICAQFLKEYMYCCGTHILRPHFICFPFVSKKKKEVGGGGRGKTPKIGE